MNLLELYCHVDDFLMAFLSEWNNQLIENKKKETPQTFAFIHQ